MSDSGPDPTSERRAVRDAYVRTGRVPLGMALRIGLRDLVVQPFWLPIKHLPGVVGMKMREWIYRQRLAHLGRGSLIDVGVEIINPRAVRIGAFTFIDRYCQFHAAEGSINIGARCHIAPYAMILGHGEVVIEDYVCMAANTKVFSISEWPGDGKRLCGPMIPQEHRGLKRAPVKLERDVLIGAGSVVMPGNTIGQGAVIGCNSVVTRDIPPWTIAVGSPAKPIGERDPVTVEDVPTV